MARTKLDISHATDVLETVRDYIRWAVTHFSQAGLNFGHGTDSAWDEAVNLVLSSLSISPDMDATVLDAKLTLAERELIAKRVYDRVEKRIPVPYLINEAWFAGYNFYVDERVLIPRSPIAELIEDGFAPWIDENSITRVLDLCTGSACIAISTALNLVQCEVDAVDISDDALAVAKKNVDKYELEDAVHLIKSDLYDKLKDRKYDVILSNPPYVGEDEYNGLPEEYRHEPQIALLADDNGLSIIRRILKGAAEHLNQSGVLIVEVGSAQMDVEAAYPNVPFTWLQFERGGEGVFLLTAEELRESAQYFV